MKKILIKISMLFIFLVPTFFALNKYRRMRVLSGISNEDYLIFSANFHDGNNGTFKYYISSGKMEKVSDYVFSDLSYSDDYKYILGTVDIRDFEGLAEIELSGNKFSSIISFDEIDDLLSNIGMDKLKYRYFRLSLRPKYYRSGYTFYNDMSDPDTLLYIENTGDSWNMEKLYGTEYKTYNYFIKEGDKEDMLFSAIQEDYYTGKGYMMKKGLSSGKEEDLFDFFIYSVNKRGRTDMTEDKSKLVYYEYPNICVYNLESEQVENMIKVNLSEEEDVWDLKFSPDGKHIFYTIKKDIFFIDSISRLTFYIVNLETLESIKLKKWKYGDNFFGFDW